MINMNRIIFIIITILTGIAVNAQTTQPGIVQEYNEKAKKTPLSGVEVTAKYAASTVSDKNGKFTLSFLTGKPGQHIDLRSIKKNGYEIFNKEAVEQWNMNPNKHLLS